jgi:hypothetical protein
MAMQQKICFINMELKNDAGNPAIRYVVKLFIKLVSITAACYQSLCACCCRINGAKLLLAFAGQYEYIQWK